MDTQQTYNLISQHDLLQRLSKQGISITSQTLRSWEKANVILPSQKEPGVAGRTALYSEFTLAECYAARKMLQGKESAHLSSIDNPNNFVEFTMPKVSLLQLSTILEYNTTPLAIDCFSLPVKNYRINNNWNPHILDKNFISPLITALFNCWSYFLKEGCDTFLKEYKLQEDPNYR